jgi:hypothetical protein
MALETLKDVKELNGFKVLDMKDRKTPNHDGYVIIDHEVNGLFFKIQNGPVKEHGVNGCQVDTLIHAAKKIIEGLNKNFPCRENSIVITKLDEAIHWLDHRTKDREKRNVEGQNKA